MFIVKTEDEPEPNVWRWQKKIETNVKALPCSAGI